MPLPVEIVHDDTLLAESLLRSNQMLREEYNKLSAEHTQLQRDLETRRHEHEAIVADLRAGIEAQEVEVKRSACWATNLFFALSELRRAATAFAGGVYQSPHSVERVIGFKPEFEAMKTVIIQPTPELPTAEAIRAAVKS